MAPVDLKDWGAIALCDKVARSLLDELCVVYDREDALKVYCACILWVCNLGVKDCEVDLLMNRKNLVGWIMFLLMVAPAGIFTYLLNTYSVTECISEYVFVITGYWTLMLFFPTIQQIAWREHEDYALSSICIFAILMVCVKFEYSIFQDDLFRRVYSEVFFSAFLGSIAWLIQIKVNRFVNKINNLMP